MNIDTDYLDRVRRLVTLCTKRKTSDLLDGDYSSRQHGRSLDFDDLREYRFGDDVGDIDWKSSSRTGKTLVRRYFADRKHDMMFVCDTGKKMTGDTPSGESKSHLALMTFGSVAYLFDKQGVNYAIAFSDARGDVVTAFQSGSGHLEKLMALYQNALRDGEAVHRLDEVLESVSASFGRHMIIVIITDGEGLALMDEKLIRRFIHGHDVYIFKLEDAYLTTPDVFDIGKGLFEDPYLAMDAALHREEVRMRTEMDETAKRLMTPYRVFFRSIDREEKIVDTLTELFRTRNKE